MNSEEECNSCRHIDDAEKIMSACWSCGFEKQYHETREQAQKIKEAVGIVLDGEYYEPGVDF